MCSAIALENVLKYFEGSRESVLVAYFYFDVNNVDKQQVRSLLSSLLFQLSTQSAAAHDALLSMYGKCQKTQVEPDKTELYSILDQIMDAAASIYVVIDALDECIERDELLRITTKLIGRPTKNLCMLMTSRLEQEIEQSLGSLVTHQTAIEKGVVDQDIRVHIQDQMTHNPRFRKWGSSHKQGIEDALMRKTNGMCVGSMTVAQTNANVWPLQVSLGSLPTCFNPKVYYTKSIG